MGEMQEEGKMKGFSIRCKAPRYPLLRKRVQYTYEELHAQQDQINRSLKALKDKK